MYVPTVSVSVATAADEPASRMAKLVRVPA